MVTKKPRSKKPGRLKVTVTHLEMTAQPDHHRAVPMPLSKVALLEAEKPTVSFYRYLYDTVGEPWLWGNRRELSDTMLKAIIHDERDTVLVLYRAGVPAGFAELFRGDDHTTEISYFGLMPEFVGQGLGRYLLQAAIERAWRDEPERLIVETCTLDHPRAVTLYQWAGFRPYAQEEVLRDDPRTMGLIPKTVAPQHPLGTE